MSKKISTLKSNPKFNDATQYREMFSPDFAVGWNAIDKHLQFMLPNRTFTHFPQQNKDEPLDNIAVCTFEDGHLYCVGYGLSQLHYDEASYGNLISKYGFELTLNIEPSEDALSLYFQCMQSIAKQIIEFDLDPFNQEQTFDLNENIITIFQSRLQAFRLIPDNRLKKMGSSHGQHQFLEIKLLK